MCLQNEKIVIILLRARKSDVGMHNDILYSFISLCFFDVSLRSLTIRFRDFLMRFSVKKRLLNKLLRFSEGCVDCSWLNLGSFAAFNIFEIVEASRVTWNERQRGQKRNRCSKTRLKRFFEASRLVVMLRAIFRAAKALEKKCLKKRAETQQLFIKARHLIGGPFSHLKEIITEEEADIYGWESIEMILDGIL